MLRLDERRKDVQLVRLDLSDGTVKGIAAFNFIVNKLKDQKVGIIRNERHGEPVNKDEFFPYIRYTIENSISDMEALYWAHEGAIGQYYRQLKVLLNFIDEADIMIKKQFYFDSLKADFSTSETVLLLYIGLSSYGRNDFYDVIVRNNLLKDTDPKTLPTASVINEYPWT